MTKILSDKDLMEMAMEEHGKSTEFPRVGCVIAKDGVILSTGHRGERKGIHAERCAIEKLMPEELKGATLFTTLEPCVKVKPDQKIGSCTDLIINSGITETVIGVLDPNGEIYSRGYEKLIKNKIIVKFFHRNQRAIIDEDTFKYGLVDEIVGGGTRWIAVVNSGNILKVKFSKTDSRTITLRWSSLQFDHGCVDLLSDNGAVRKASGAADFGDISDPMVFRFQSHYARMKMGDIAIVQPPESTFCVLIKLLNMDPGGIKFKWETRNSKYL